jgi:thioesterase domain-containing protein
MSIIEARNNHEKRGFVVDTSAGLQDSAPVATPRQSMQDSSTTPISQRPQSSSDEARAMVWSGILGAAKHIGNRAPMPMRQRQAVVQLRQGTAATPVYFIGAGLYELHIAQLMPSEHSIYAVEIAWPAAWHDASAQNDTPATPVLEEMVGPYVEALSAHMSSDPCVLVGYSFHGLMAFEIAHQLLRKGGKVDMVVVVDSPSDYPAAYKIAWRNFRDVWASATGAVTRTPSSLASRLQKSLAIGTWALIEGLRDVKRRFVEIALRDPGKLTTKLDTLGRPMQWRLIERLYANSIRSYRLHRLDCRGVVIRGDRPEDCPVLNTDYAMGWTGLFGQGLELIKVTGDHITMMRQHPHDLHLAKEMAELLDRSHGATAASASREAAAKQDA